MHLSPSNSVWNSLTWPEMLNRDREWGLQPGILTYVGPQRNHIWGHPQGCVHPSAVLSRWWNARSGPSTPEYRQSQHRAKELCGAWSDISPFFLVPKDNFLSLIILLSFFPASSQVQNESGVILLLFIFHFKETYILFCLICLFFVSQVSFII